MNLGHRCLYVCSATYYIIFCAQSQSLPHRITIWLTWVQNSWEFFMIIRPYHIDLLLIFLKLKLILVYVYIWKALPDLKYRAQSLTSRNLGSFGKRSLWQWQNCTIFARQLRESSSSHCYNQKHHHSQDAWKSKMFQTRNLTTLNLSFYWCKALLPGRNKV